MATILKKDVKVKYVYQISDIHLMKNSDRDEEYELVFDRLIESIDPKDAIVVCCGDLYHDGMSPKSIKMAKKLMKRLGEKMDIIIIRGNHDMTTRTNENMPDMVDASITDIRTVHGVYMPIKTGTYIYGNIAFGYMDVIGATDVYEIKEDIGDRIKIGLWHGTMGGMNRDECKEDGIMNTKYKLEGKKGFTVIKFSSAYDIVMLGDIHKHQEFDNGKIAYSGSLIQQNFGEDDEHGYIKWNLKKRTGTFCKIENDYGYMTIDIKDGTYKIPELIPKFVRLRIRGEVKDDKQEGEIQKEVSKKCEKIIQYMSNVYSKHYELIGVLEEQINNQDISATDVIMKYIEKDILKNKSDSENDDSEETPEKSSDLPTERTDIQYKKEDIVKSDLQEIRKLLEETESKVRKDIKINDSTNIGLREITLKKLEFSNFGTYDEDNCIEYDKLKGIINVSGRNGSGKTTLTVNALLYSIFGDGDKMKDINYIRGNEKHMKTKIELCVNKDEYIIIRDVTRDGTGTKKKVSINVNGKEIAGEDLKKITDLDKYIVENICTPEDFVGACVMRQNKVNGFLNMTGEIRHKYMCDMLGLKIYLLMMKELKTKKKIDTARYNDAKNKVYEKNTENNHKEVFAERNIKYKEENDRIKEALEKIEIVVDKLRSKLESGKTEIAIIDNLIKKYDDDEKPASIEEIKKQQKDNKKIIKRTEKINDDLSEEIKKLKKKTSNMATLEKKHNKIEKKKNEKDKELKETRDKMLREYVDIVKMDELNKEDIEKERDKIMKEIDELNKNININEQTFKETKERVEKYKTLNDKKYDEYVELKNTKDMNVKTMKNLEETIGELKDKITEMTKEYKRNKSKLAKVNDEKTEVDEKLKDYKNLSEKLDELDKKIEQSQEYLNTTANVETYENVEEPTDEEIDILEHINIENKYEKYKEIEKSYNELKEEIDKLHKELDTYTKRDGQLKGHKYNPECKICMSNDLTKEKLEVEEMLVKLNNDIEKHDEEFEKINDKKEKMQKYERLMLASKMITSSNIMRKRKERMDEINKCKNEKQEMMREKERLENRRDELTKKIDSITKEMKNYNETDKELKESEEKMEKIQEEIKVNDEKINILEKYKERYEKHQRDKEEMNNCIINKNKYADNLSKFKLMKEMNIKKNEEYEKNEKSKKRNAELDKEIEKINEEIKENSEMRCDEYDECMRILEEIDEKQQIVNDNSNIIEHSKQELKILEKDMINSEKYAEKQEEYNNAKSRYEILKPEVEKITNEVRDKNAIIDKNKMRLQELEILITEHNKNKENMKLLEKRERLELMIVDTLKSGFEEDILSKSIIPDLCDRVNKMLKGYVNYKIKMIYDKKNIIVTKDEDGQVNEMMMASGYETMMGNIAFKVALNEMSKRIKTKFFIVDEGFSQCDTETLNKISELFDFLRSTYEYVLVITHDSQIQAYTTSSIHIVKKGGKTHINTDENSCKKDDDNKSNIVTKKKK